MFEATMKFDIWRKGPKVFHINLLVCKPMGASIINGPLLFSVIAKKIAINLVIGERMQALTYVSISKLPYIQKVTAQATL